MACVIWNGVKFWFDNDTTAKGVLDCFYDAGVIPRAMRPRKVRLFNGKNEQLLRHHAVGQGTLTARPTVKT